MCFQKVSEPPQVSSTPCLSWTTKFSIRSAAEWGLQLFSNMATMQTTGANSTVWPDSTVKSKKEESIEQGKSANPGQHWSFCLSIKEPGLIQRAFFTKLQHWLNGAPPKYPFPQAKAGLVPESQVLMLTLACHESRRRRCQGRAKPILNVFQVLSCQSQILYSRRCEDTV